MASRYLAHCYRDRFVSIRLVRLALACGSTCCQPDQLTSARRSGVDAMATNADHSNNCRQSVAHRTGDKSAIDGAVIP